MRSDDDRNAGPVPDPPDDDASTDSDGVEEGLEPNDDGTLPVGG